MSRRTARALLLAGGELLGWWAVLVLVWLVFISSVYTLEWVVGASVAAVGALLARAGRRAVTWR